MKLATFGFVAVAVLALVVTLWADAPPLERTAARLTQAWGTVKSVDVTAKTLVIAGKLSRDGETRDLTFLVAGTTKIFLPAGGDGAGTKAGTLADLKPDQRVVVLYDTTADGSMAALSITVLGGASR